jgi:hypothetical protein
VAAVEGAGRREFLIRKVAASRPARSPHQFSGPVRLARPPTGDGGLRRGAAAALTQTWTQKLRAGAYLGVPKPPFTPGYDLVGVAEELGPACTSLREGDRIAAATATVALWGLLSPRRRVSAYRIQKLREGHQVIPRGGADRSRWVEAPATRSGFGRTSASCSNCFVAARSTRSWPSACRSPTRAARTSCWKPPRRRESSCSFHRPMEARWWRSPFRGLEPSTKGRPPMSSCCPWSLR